MRRCAVFENAHILRACCAFQKPRALPDGLILVSQHPVRYVSVPGVSSTAGEHCRHGSAAAERLNRPFADVTNILQDYHTDLTTTGRAFGLMDDTVRGKI